MSKIVCYGDLHGNPIWKQIVEKEQDADLVIFLGDYFDSFIYSTVEQIYNFNEIIEFKKANPNNVILLIGNHDYHYFPEIGDRGISGYQGSAKATAISYELNKNRDLLQMAFAHDNILFTHAGVGLSWIERLSYWMPDLLPPEFNAQSISDYVNDVWKYKPLFFNFIGRDDSGDDMGQTPIWIRPRSLMKDGQNFKKNLIQVVGHTSVKSIDFKGKSTGGKYYFIDALNSNNEYLIIENNQFTSNKILKL